VPDLCRKHGVAQSTYYQWKSKYGGMEASDLSRLNALEEGNRKLKNLFADVSLQNMALKDVIELGLGVVLVCEAFKISCCMYYYQPKLVDDTVIIDALSTLAEKHPKYGF